MLPIHTDSLSRVTNSIIHAYSLPYYITLVTCPLSSLVRLAIRIQMVYIIIYYGAYVIPCSDSAHLRLVFPIKESILMYLSDIQKLHFSKCPHCHLHQCVLCSMVMHVHDLQW
jgi:hypothetical protein